MNSTIFAVTLVVTVLFHSGVAVPTDDSKNLKLSETPNKHGSSQLYVFGGYDSGKSYDRYLSSASQFNSSTGEWKRITSMSMARQAPCAAVFGTKIYLFGGRNESGMDTETAEVYDTETGIYSPFTSMPRPRFGCGAAVLDGFIYVAGGWDGDNLASVIRYNIQTTRMENVSPMPKATWGLQLAALNNRLYAINVGYNTVQAYNPATDQWTVIASTHIQHPCPGVAIHDEKIYVFSGNGFEVYSPETDQWEKLTPPGKYRLTTLVSMNGKLWLLGGSTWSEPPTKSVFAYDTITKKWTQQADMDVARSDFAAFVVNH